MLFPLTCLFAAIFSRTLAVSVPAADEVHVYWNITYVQNISPDGLFPRRVIGVNGTWPPPPHIVNSNNKLFVHATNSLDEPTTLHHHGMFFNTTTWMDGAYMVSQCGIPPGQTFTYVVDIANSGQWGTYWVHSHASGHYPDGLRAPFLIHHVNKTAPTTSTSTSTSALPASTQTNIVNAEVHSYDDEYTVVLGDWYHEQHATLLQQFINIRNPGGAEPVPDSALIYYLHNGAYVGPTDSTVKSITGTSVGFNQNATMSFAPGKTYRLRIVNTGTFAMFFFWIDGHDMRVIEVDGTDVEEYPISMLSVTVAQRYSVLVTARNDTTVANWAIHANMDTDMFDTVPDALNPNVTSSITYDANADLQDLGFIDEYMDVPDLELVPTEVIAQPVATKVIELEVVFDTMDDGTNHAMFNQMTFNYGRVPTTFSALSLGPLAVNESAYVPLSFVLNHQEVVDIVIKNGDAGKHPFHLHGHKPMLVGRSDDYTSDNTTLNPPIMEGQANPVRRDTVQIPSMGSATLRVVSDNPGVWMLHCHIEWHLQVGLAIQLVEAPLQAQAQASAGNANTSVPQELYDHCTAQGFLTSGNAGGLNSATDLGGLKFGPHPQILGWRPRGIGAMAGCVLAAVLGMAAVIWYGLGSAVDDKEWEQEAAHRQTQKENRGRFWGLGKSIGKK